MEDCVPNVETAKVWLCIALEQLQSHTRQLGDASESWGELRTACQAGEGCLEIWWRGVVGSRVSRDMLWDRLRILDADESGLAELRKLVPRFSDTVRVIAGETAPRLLTKPRTEPPMFAYHPQRIRTLAPFGRELARLGLYGAGPIGVWDEQDTYALNLMLQSTMMSRPQDAAYSPVRKRVFGDEEPGAHQSAVEGYHLFMWFERAGRNIFDVPPLMAEMFQHTDIDDLPANELKMPYQALYVALHPKEDLLLRKKWPFDGAYVVWGDDGSLHIALTARPPSVEDFLDTKIAIEPMHVQHIPAKYMSMTLGQAVTHSLADDLRHVQSRLITDIPVGVRAMMKATGVRLTNTSQHEIDEQQRLLRDRQPLYEQALRMVVNSLMYLTAYPDDIERTWPADAPERLLAQATNPTEKAKQRRNAESKLLALGYTAIHLCGRKFREDEGARPERRGGRTRVELDEERITWVKGFWTPQAHGPKWSLRKWLWRKPHKRRLHTVEPAPEDGAGHLYLVT
jgi:hypothetical protein